MILCLRTLEQKGGRRAKKKTKVFFKLGWEEDEEANQEYRERGRRKQKPFSVKVPTVCSN